MQGNITQVGDAGCPRFTPMGIPRFGSLSVSTQSRWKKSSLLVMWDLTDDFKREKCVDMAEGSVAIMD